MTQVGGLGWSTVAGSSAATAEPEDVLPESECEKTQQNQTNGCMCSKSFWVDMFLVLVTNS